tara:strand:+ start:1954 stop:2862 length:909 start_codon:yes stop_codon:yes gene_type:complete
MKDLIKFERLAHQSAKAQINTEFIELAHDGEVARLSVVPDVRARVCVDRCEYTNDVVVCHGWAFLQYTGQPARRLFLVQGDKVVAVATAELRVDVRQKLPTNYDFTGYRLKFKPDQLVFNGERMTLVVAVEGGVVLKEVECKSALTSKLVNATRLVQQGSKARFQTEDLSNSFDFTLTKGIKYHLDSVDWDHPKLSIRGWCALTTDLDKEVKVGIVIDEKIIMLPQPCNRERPDVAHEFNYKDGSHLFGYQLSVVLDANENVEAADIKLVFITEDKAEPKARIVSLYSSTNFFGRVISKVAS